MGKQTMGTPAHALLHRADNKLFRILFPQAPLVQTKRYAEYQVCFAIAVTIATYEHPNRWMSILKAQMRLLL
jgi:hypothetical protein